MKRSAFTLVELLVVIAVVAILVGLMVPLVQGMHKRTLASDAKDLCVQVADAWELLTVDYGRFPDKEVVKAQAQTAPSSVPAGIGGTKVWEYGGDVAFAMTPGAGNLLNFWTPRSPLPKTDENVFKQNLAHANVTWKGGGDPPSQEEVDKWKADTRFERSSAQKRFGVFARGSQDDESDGDDRLSDRPKDASCLVVVMIDADGDGIIRLKEGRYWLVGKTDDGNGNAKTEEIRRRAVAWCKVARADDQLVFSWK